MRALEQKIELKNIEYVINTSYIKRTCMQKIVCALLTNLNYAIDVVIKYIEKLGTKIVIPAQI